MSIEKKDSPMAMELEAKFRVADFRAVRRALRSAGAVYRGTAEERDVFFDTPDRSLLAAGKGLRLRRVKVIRYAPSGRGGVRGGGPAGGRTNGWLLTVKGPARRGSRLKIRSEVQTVVADGPAMREILQAVGLREFVTLTKRRASYRLASCQVELDELAELGRFVEIEGPSARAVELVRRRLVLPDEPINRSYLAMIAAGGSRPGRPVGAT